MRFRIIFFLLAIHLNVSVLSAQNPDSLASATVSYNDTLQESQANIQDPLSKESQLLDPVPLESGSFRDSLLRMAEIYKGTPYRLGGHSSRGFDCSGFVNFLYSKFDHPLAYSCTGIAMKCEKIEKQELQKGDLIFFKGRNIRSKALGHVSIVCDIDSTGGVRMIHATQRGVVTDYLSKSSYYKPRLLFYARVKNNG